MEVKFLKTDAKASASAAAAAPVAAVASQSTVIREGVKFFGVLTTQPIAEIVIKPDDLLHIASLDIAQKKADS